MIPFSAPIGAEPGVDSHAATVFVAREDVEYFQAVEQLGNPIIHCSVRAVSLRRWTYCMRVYTDVA